MERNEGQGQEQDQVRGGDQGRDRHGAPLDEHGKHERALPTVPDDESAPLSEEELRLMADTMPGEGPGDD